MATYTREELRNAILSDLTVTDAAEAPTAADSVFVLARINQTLEMLASDSYGLIPFDIEGDEIPGPYFLPLAQIVAPTLALAYGKGDKMQTLKALAAEGLKELRRLKAKPYYGTTAPANYF